VLAVDRDVSHRRRPLAPDIGRLDDPVRGQVVAVAQAIGRAAQAAQRVGLLELLHGLLDEGHLRLRIKRLDVVMPGDRLEAARDVLRRPVGVRKDVAGRSCERQQADQRPADPAKEPAAGGDGTLGTCRYRRRVVADARFLSHRLGTREDPR
jgi:hypothetical protein